MERIASFTVNHDVLVPGLYLSRRDGDVTTFDLRFKKPNTGDLLTNAQMHSVEHIIATLLRNSPEKDAVIYFGPMGCQTGFYFLFDSRRLTDEAAIRLVQRVFAAGAVYDGPMPGKSAAECGNFRNLDTALARDCCAWYADRIRNWTPESLTYPQAEAAMVSWSQSFPNQEGAMSARKLVYTALLAALTAVGAFIRIPIGISVITLQFLFTAMAGVLLGPGGGALSQGVYVALGLVGLPIFTAGGGFGYVLQPSFGFLLGLIPAAAVIGGLSRRSSSPVRLALACGAGLAVLYAVGVPYMALILNGYLGKGISAPALLWSGMLIYLPGDAAKIAVTALLCPVLRRRVPGLR